MWAGLGVPATAVLRWHSTPPAVAGHDGCGHRERCLARPTEPSRLIQKFVHDPAAPNVRAWRAEVGEDLSPGTAGILQGVREYGEPRILKVTVGQDALVVCGERDGGDVARPPCGVEEHGAERVAEHVAYE